MGHRLPAVTSRRKDLNNNPLSLLLNNPTYVAYVLPDASVQHLSMQNCGLQGDSLEQVMSFFDTKQLRSLNLSRNLLGFDSAPAIVRLLHKLPQLQELDMRHVGVLDDIRVSDAVLAHPNIHTFCSIPIERLKHSAAAFQTLDLACLEIGGHGGHVLAAAMCENKSITHLNIRSNSLSQTSMVALFHMLGRNSTLAHLNLENNAMGVSEAIALAKALRTNTTIASLVLRWNTIGPRGTQALAEAIAHHPSLTFLDVAGNNIGNAGVAALGRCLISNNRLTTLDLSVNNIGGYSTSTETNPIADIGVLADALAVNQSLTRLFLRANTVSEYAAERLATGLAGNRNISHLSLDWNPVGGSGLAALLTALIGNTSLQVLHLCSCKLTLHCALPLAMAVRTWPALQELAISDNYLGVHGMAAITHAVADCRNFKSLKLGRCRCWGNTQTRATMQSMLDHLLSTSASIRRLCLADNGLSEELLPALHPRHAQAAQVMELDLSKNPLRGSAVDALVMLIGHTEQLKVLKLRATCMSNFGVIKVLAAIRLNNTLEHLDLERSYDDGHEPSVTKQLVEALLDNCSIKTMCLGGNRIQDAGASHLAQLLAVNSTLRHLRLDANNIEAPGARSIAEVLPFNAGLQTISFNANPLTENSGKLALIDAIPQSISLQHISLRPLSTGRYSSVVADHARLDSKFAESINLRVQLRLLVRQLASELCAGPTTVVLSYLWNGSAREMLQSLGLEQKPERLWG